VKYTKTENGISIELVMDPLASRFVVFRKNSSGKNDTGLQSDLQYGFQKSKKISETVDITDNWDLRFNTEMGGPKKYKMDRLTSWSDVVLDSVRYYSGSATYSRDFKMDKETLTGDAEAYVFFEDIQEMARVFVNGQDCGIVWTPPYKKRITPYLKNGTNNITVEVINTWNNRIVGDVRNPDKKQYTRTNIKNKFKRESPLLKSGLLGKCEIVFANK
jgi:hypothetical protein